MPYVQREQSTPAEGTMAAYVNAYLEHLTVRHYAEQTIEYKRMSLNRFTDWLTERGIYRLTDVTRPMLQRYQRHLFYATTRGGKPLSAAGQANRLAAVRGLFKYLTQQNHLLYNPASELELPKPAKTLPKDVLTAEEAEQVLSQPDIDTPLGLRDRAILEVLYSTGIRRMELINLEQRDVNINQGVLAVRQGKGRKDRFVPVGERALQWLDKYLTDVRPELEVTDTHTLFLDPAGRKMDPHQLSRAVQRYVKQSGVNKKGRCHLFRHTMATLMLENGADIRFIQEILGHSKLSTTEIYTRVSVHKLKAVHTATHPAKDNPAASTGGVEHPTADVLLDTLAAEAEDDD
jgi:integrase/recombinase XerD